MHILLKIPLDYLFVTYEKIEIRFSQIFEPQFYLYKSIVLLFDNGYTRAKMTVIIPEQYSVHK